jgi:hypothetical protein
MSPKYTIHPSQKNRTRSKHLMGSSAGLGDDSLELVNLGLSTAEGTETLLCELAGALVLAVAEEFDNATLVWGKSTASQ